MSIIGMSEDMPCDARRRLRLRPPGLRFCLRRAEIIAAPPAAAAIGASPTAICGNSSPRTGCPSSSVSNDFIVSIVWTIVSYGMSASSSTVASFFSGKRIFTRRR